MIKNIFRYIKRSFLIGLLSLVLLLALLPSIINSHPVNNYFSDKLSKYFSTKYRSPVKIDGFKLSLYPSLKLYNACLLDQHSDTIFVSKEITITLSYSDLFAKKVHFTKFTAKNLKYIAAFNSSNIFNLDFLINYYRTSNEKESNSDWVFSIDGLESFVQNGIVEFIDRHNHIFFHTCSKELSFSIESSLLNAAIFHIGSFKSFKSDFNYEYDCNYFSAAFSQLNASNIFISPLTNTYFSSHFLLSNSAFQYTLNDTNQIYMDSIDLECNKILLNPDYYAFDISKFNSRIPLLESFFSAKGMLHISNREIKTHNFIITNNQSNVSIESSVYFNGLESLVNFSILPKSTIQVAGNLYKTDFPNFLDSNLLSFISDSTFVYAKMQANNQSLLVDSICLSSNDNILDVKMILRNISNLKKASVLLSAKMKLSPLILDTLLPYRDNQSPIFLDLFLQGRADSFALKSKLMIDNNNLLWSKLEYSRHNLDLTFFSNQFPFNIVIADSLVIGKSSIRANISHNFSCPQFYDHSLADVYIKNININNNSISNVSIDYNFVNDKAALNIISNDSLLNFVSNTIISHNDGVWSSKGNLDINNFDTSLISDSISINNLKSQIQFAINYSQKIDFLKCKLLGTELNLNKKILIYPEINIAFNNRDTAIFASLESTPINANLESNIDVDSLKVYFVSLLQRYFSDSIVTDSLVFRNQYFNLFIDVKAKDPLLNFYTNNLFNFSKANLDLKSDLSQGLRASLILPIYKYKTMTFEGVKVNMLDENRFLSYQLNMNNFLWDTINLPNVEVYGMLSENIFKFNLSNKTNTDSISNKINFEMNRQDDDYWSLTTKNNCLLYSNKWAVKGDGIITNFNTIKSADLAFEKDSSSLIINSVDNNIKFDARSIILDSNITQFIGIPFSGVLSFHIEGDKQKIRESLFSANIEIDSLLYMSNNYGTLRAEIFKQDSGVVLSTKAELINRNSTTSIIGYYDFDNKNYKTDLILNQFPLSLINPFVDDLSGLTGVVNGNISSNFVNSKSHLIANLKLNNNKFTYELFNTQFNINKGDIRVTDDKMFVDFSIADVDKNSAQLSGDVGLENNPRINLGLKTSKFILMDNTEKSKPQFNGKLIVGTDSKITGTMKSPNILSYISLKQGTNINIYNDQNALSDGQQSSDIVIFKTPEDTILNKEIIKDTSVFNNTNIKANIEIDEKTKLKIILDPINSDYLLTEGGGNLSYDLSVNGDESLTGTYFITKGEYKATFQELISKKFNIEDNSTIVWIGDKENPQLHLKTYYTFRTSPYALASGTGSMSSKEKELYSSLQDFRLNMEIKGDLKNPELSFKIESVENKSNSSLTSINNSIERINNDPSELNQQVFSILLFNKFLSLDNETSSANTDVIVNSLGQLFTSELNKLTSEYINFVDIDLGFNAQNNPDSVGSSYKTTIDLNIQKSFYNNRLKIKLGSVWDVQDNSTSMSKKNYKNDFSVEYNLTEDGRYVVKVFNKDDRDYDGTDITRNGISLIYSKDFNKFNILFRKSKKQEVEK